MKDAALKLALEALQWSKPHEGAVLTYGAAITAIKAALAQPTSGDYALGYVEGFNDACKPKHEWVCGECVKCGQSIERQEPIPFGIRGGMAHDIGIKND